MKNDLRLNVGIVIPTLNRPDFVIRQLEYYAKIKSSHPVYIGDASNKENSIKLQEAIKKSSKHLTIHYYTQPENCTVPEAHLSLYSRVEEKYCIFSGDDDYQIPNSLTKCAEFLENNPEYSSASGHAITFRLVNNGVYGELRRLADYPRQQIESSTATQRLIDFMTKYNVTVFSVQRTKQMIKCWSQANTMAEIGFANEILPCAMSSVLGKSKIIDCLSLVRQLDNQKLVPINTLEWITKKDWNPSYETFCEILAKEISEIDNVSINDARKIPRQAFWGYLNTYLPIEYGKANLVKTNTKKKSSGNLLNKSRLYLGKKWPWLKNIYFRINNSVSNAPRQIHREIVLPSSPYFKDFQSVFNSFSGKM